jgi:predicted nucleic acid-binding protein
MATPKLFVDASVFIAAAASPTGGSAAVLKLGQRRRVRLFGSRLVLIEAERNIRLKLPQEILRQFYIQIGSIDLKLVKPPNADEITAARAIVAEKDAHVLAAAVKGRVNVLVTLDRKHLLTDTVRRASPIPIQTPGDFLQEFGESSPA